MAARRRGPPSEQRLTSRLSSPQEDSAFLAALGRRVRMQRARRGMTRKALAQQSGVSERFISAVETGTGNGSILLLRAIAQALNVPLMAVLEDEAAAPPAPAVRAEGYRQRVALIGLRGAGKSTLGPLLAARMGVPFVQLDREIERVAGLGLGEILELHGQAGFRRLEHDVLAALLAAHPALVLEAGGGVVAEADTYATLRAGCFTIWLRASPEEHMQRVIDQGDLRPMRDNRHALDDLRAILASREGLYAQADASVDTAGRAVHECLRELESVVGT